MTVTELPAPPKIRRASSGEVCRKFMHMSPGCLPFVLTAVPHPDPLDATSIGIVAAICVLLTGLFIALARVVRREGEENFLSTALSYPLTVLAVLVLFPARAEFAMVVVVVLAFGDGSAYIGGKLLGRRRLPWNQDKSWAGTLSFVAVSAPIAAWAYWLEARPSVPFSTALACGAAAAVAGAVAESLPVRLTDNARVGVAAGFAVAVTGLLLV
ncbi:MAG: hypothetical protein KY476_26495 [Planctomycetes bacterium]|nr:hypothetical protein [Planctomycetota bacterium]